MKVKIIKGIEAAGKFPFGFMSNENAQFLENNVGKMFQAERICINGYELDVKLNNGKPAFVHVYNAMEVHVG